MIFKPLHICMVVYAPYPFAETRVQREAEALMVRGHSVDVICPKYQDSPEQDQHNGVNIYRVNMHWDRKSDFAGQLIHYLNFFIRAFLRITYLHAKNRYHVIQTHNIPDFLVFSSLIPKLMGSRIILDLHDLMPEFFQSRVGENNHKFLSQMIVLQERLSCKFADHVITVTEHWRQNLIKRGMPPDKCSVVMNLADDKVFRPIPFSTLKDPNRFCLFYHGGMPHRYGLDLILFAMNKLHAKIPTILLKLIGDGDACETLKQTTFALKLEDRVEFINSQPVEKLQSFIATADVAVVPYLDDPFTDSLMPTKLMEYAVCGIPSIVSRTTAISAYFTDQMVEFFQPGSEEELANAILRLYKDPGRRRELACNIQKFNEKYNWSEQSASYISRVESLCLNGKRH